MLQGDIEADTGALMANIYGTQRAPIQPGGGLLMPSRWPSASGRTNGPLGKRDEWAARICRYVVTVMAPGAKLKIIEHPTSAQTFSGGKPTSYTVEGVGCGLSGSEAKAWFDAAQFCHSQNPDRYMKLKEVAEICECMMAPDGFEGIANLENTLDEDDELNAMLRARDAVRDAPDPDPADRSLSAMMTRFWKRKKKGL